jgi:putative endonuclease
MKPKYRRMIRTMESGKNEPWFLYILECNDGSFYTGVTKDLDRRVSEHNAGKASRYTRIRLPVTLRYHEKCSGRAAALVRECEVKGYSRKKKEELVGSIVDRD